MFRKLALLENIIYSQVGKNSYDMVEKAKRIHNKILCNMKLTRYEQNFLAKIDK